MTIRIDRLEQLAAFLDELPPERFFYGRWVGSDWQGAADLSCGTRACAGGWATTLWPDELELVNEFDGELFEDAWVRHKLTGTETSEAMADLFDIARDDARRLFVPHYGLGPYATPKQVAAHIRAFIREKTETP